MEDNEVFHEFQRFRRNLQKVVVTIVGLMVLTAIVAGPRLYCHIFTCPNQHRMAQEATLNGDGTSSVWWDTINTNSTTAVCSHCEQSSDEEWFCEDCSTVNDPTSAK